MSANTLCGHITLYPARVGSDTSWYRCGDNVGCTALIARHELGEACWCSECVPAPRWDGTCVGLDIEALHEMVGERSFECIADEPALWWISRVDVASVWGEVNPVIDVVMSERDVVGVAHISAGLQFERYRREHERDPICGHTVVECDCPF